MKTYVRLSKVSLLWIMGLLIVGFLTLIISVFILGVHSLSLASPSFDLSTFIAASGAVKEAVSFLAFVTGVCFLLSLFCLGVLSKGEELPPARTPVNPVTEHPLLHPREPRFGGGPVVDPTEGIPSSPG